MTTCYTHINWYRCHTVILRHLSPQVVSIGLFLSHFVHFHTVKYWATDCVVGSTQNAFLPKNVFLCKEWEESNSPTHRSRTFLLHWNFLLNNGCLNNYDVISRKHKLFETYSTGRKWAKWERNRPTETTPLLSEH